MHHACCVAWPHSAVASRPSERASEERKGTPNGRTDGRRGSGGGGDSEERGGNGGKYDGGRPAMPRHSQRVQRERERERERESEQLFASFLGR